jgi:hypothetical protein
MELLIEGFEAQGREVKNAHSPLHIACGVHSWRSASFGPSFVYLAEVDPNRIIRLDNLCRRVPVEFLLPPVF